MSRSERIDVVVSFGMIVDRPKTTRYGEGVSGENVRVTGLRVAVVERGGEGVDCRSQIRPSAVLLSSRSSCDPLDTSCSLSDSLPSSFRFSARTSFFRRRISFNLTMMISCVAPP